MAEKRYGWRVAYYMPGQNGWPGRWGHLRPTTERVARQQFSRIGPGGGAARLALQRFDGAAADRTDVEIIDLAIRLTDD
jgi:hypothetical protein